MSAPVRDAAAPAPTVRPPGHRAARALLVAGWWPLILGICGGAFLWIIGRRVLALEAGIPCLAAAAGLLAAAAVVAVRARRIRVNPAAVIPLIAAAAAAAWFAMPAAGLSALRLPAESVAAYAAVRAGQVGVRYRRRRAAEDRIAQVLAPELAQAIGQAEQVYGSLAGAIDRGRATAPNFGIAPRAAWEVRGTRWDGDRILGAVLRLPAHTGIANPDFLARLRLALTERVTGVENVRFAVNPRRDEILMDFDVPPDAPVPETNRRQAAAGRAKTAICQALQQKDVQVDVLDWDEADTPGGAPLAWPLRRFRVRYEQTPKVTADASREMLRVHMSLQLFGDDAVLRAEWDLGADTVIFTRRPEFPETIPHRPVDVSAVFGNVIVIVHATDEDGNLVGWQWTKTDAPHELVSGPTGTGKTVDERTTMIEAARQGHEVRGIDPKRIEMRGLRGWPNVTMIATTVPDMIDVINKTFDDMMDRYAKIEAGEARAEDFRMIGLWIDEYLMMTMLINDYWADQPKASGESKEHPVFRKLTALLVLARGANIRVRIHSQRVDATLFSDRTLGGVRDNLAARVALGRQTKESALMMFGDATAGRDIPLGAVAVGTVLSPAGRVRAKMHWLPDPAYWHDPVSPLILEERQLLLDMLPPGSHWDGPEPYRPPAEDGADGDGRPNPARRLLFFTRTALRTREAYLTDGTTGGPPASGSDLAFYGWGLDAAGNPEHSGKWIGCVTSTPEGRRVYLHPESALPVVKRLAVPLEVPFPYSRKELDAALHGSGLLKTEGTDGGKTRWTVRHQLPGNDLGGRDDRQRVWDLPAEEVLGDLGRDDDDATAPAGPLRALPAAPAGETPPWEPGPPAGSGSPVCEARQLGEGARIIIVGDDGRAAAATVLFKREDGDDLIIDYAPDSGPPDSIRVQPGQYIRLADHHGEA